MKKMPSLKSAGTTVKTAILVYSSTMEVVLATRITLTVRKNARRVTKVSLVGLSVGIFSTLLSVYFLWYW